MNIRQYVFVAVGAAGLVIGHSKLFSMEEELEITHKQSPENIIEVIKEAIKKTTSLAEINKTYARIQEQVDRLNKKTNKLPLLTQLENEYSNHIMTHDMKFLDNDDTAISGEGLLNIYRSLYAQLKHIIEQLPYQHVPSSPFVPAKTKETDIINQVDTTIEKFAPYHQQLIRVTVVQEKLDHAQKKLITRLEQAKEVLEASIKSGFELNDALTTAMNMSSFNTKLQDVALDIQQAKKAQLKESGSFLYKYKPSNPKFLIEKEMFDTHWAERFEALNNRYKQELVNAMPSIIKLLEAITQAALALHQPHKKNVFDGGFIGGLGGLNSMFTSHKKRIAPVTQALLTLAYPYMTPDEIFFVLKVPYQPTQPTKTDFDYRGFIHDPIIKLLDEKEQTLYLKVRGSTMQEVMKALELIKEL